MAFLQRILLFATTLVPAIIAHPTCHPHANFSLTAHAPGAPFDGYLLYAAFVNSLIELSPNAKPDSYSTGIFFKNDTTRLYTYLLDDESDSIPLPVVPQIITSSLAGDFVAEANLTADRFPHWEEYFTTSLELWPPAGFVDFKPGTLINPGTYGQQPDAPGGFYACYYSTLSTYFVYGGTHGFLTGEAGTNTPSTCTPFRPEIKLLGFSPC